MLNQERVVSPRPGTRKRYDSWCPSAIREILRRELYIGVVVWNRSKWVKEPGTNRRLRRPWPRKDWKRSVRPELRIVDQDDWDAVQAKNAMTMAKYSAAARKGLAHRSETAPYLLSGFLKCGECGANLVITSGRGGKYARYGCPQHRSRGTCGNTLTTSVSAVEQTFFAELQRHAVQPEAVDFTVAEFSRQLQTATNAAGDEKKNLLGQKAKLNDELDKLSNAIAAGPLLRTVKKAMESREHEFRSVEEKLKTIEKSVPIPDLKEMRDFVVQHLFDLVGLINHDKTRAKHELRKHLDQLTMTPTVGTDGTRFYVGEGKWHPFEASGWPSDLRNMELGNAGSTKDLRASSERMSVTSREPRDCRVRLVAGGGFVPQWTTHST